MGYALFTARKLMLQNRLNQMNYRMMVLSQQRNKLVEDAANEEMKMGIRKSLGSIFVNNEAQGLYKQLSEGLASKGAITIGKDSYGLGTSAEVNAASNAINARLDELNTTNSTAELASKSKLQSIQTIENQIDLEMKKLDTQVKETTAEMESVEKAEDQAIKNSAPKYGGGGG